MINSRLSSKKEYYFCQRYSEEKTLKAFSYIVIMILVIYRRPDAFYDAQFWGEEGSVFYAEAYHQGLSSLFHACGGYFHLIPRILSLGCVKLSVPLHIVPFVFTYSWLLILLFLIRLLWKRVLLHDWQKFCLSISLMLIPIQSEVVINQTNMQWILAVFPLIILLYPSAYEKKSELIGDLLIVIFCGLSGPNFTVLLPLFIWQSFKVWQIGQVQSGYFKVLLLSVILGITGAMAILSTGGFDRTEGEFHITNAGFIQYFFIQYAFLFIGKVSTHLPPSVMFAGALLIVAVFFWILKTWVWKKKDKNIFILLIFGWLFLISSLIAYRHQPEWPNPYYNSTRNFYLPAITVVWMIVFLLGNHKHGKTVISALMVLFAFQLIVFIGSEKMEDRQLEKYSNQIHTADTISIPINPEGWRIFIDNKKVIH